jgi:hypothetical protein
MPGVEVDGGLDVGDDVADAHEVVGHGPFSSSGVVVGGSLTDVQSVVGRPRRLITIMTAAVAALALTSGLDGERLVVGRRHRKPRLRRLQQPDRRNETARVAQA